MTKLTTHRFKIPVLIALAIAVATSGAHAAVDASIRTEAVADAQAAPIEEVGFVAKDFGQRMASGPIKMNPANARALGDVLTQAIVAKDPTLPENNWTNKADEIAEAAAIVVAEWATSTSTRYTKKKAGKLTLMLVKGVFSSTKKNETLLSAAVPNLFRDVAGSIMLTLVRASGTDAAFDEKLYKVMKKGFKNFGGKPNKALVVQGLDEGKLNDAVANAIYEDGNMGPIIDPETDTRNG